MMGVQISPSNLAVSAHNPHLQRPPVLGRYFWGNQCLSSAKSQCHSPASADSSIFTGFCFPSRASLPGSRVTLCCPGPAGASGKAGLWQLPVSSALLLILSNDLNWASSMCQRLCRSCEYRTYFLALKRVKTRTQIPNTREDQRACFWDSRFTKNKLLPFQRILKTLTGVNWLKHSEPSLQL